MILEPNNTSLRSEMQKIQSAHVLWKWIEHPLAPNVPQPIRVIGSLGGKVQVDEWQQHRSGTISLSLGHIEVQWLCRMWYRVMHSIHFICGIDPTQLWPNRHYDPDLNQNQVDLPNQPSGMLNQATQHVRQGSLVNAESTDTSIFGDRHHRSSNNDR